MFGIGPRCSQMLARTSKNDGFRFPPGAGIRSLLLLSVRSRPELGGSFQPANDSYNLANHLGILSTAQPQELRQPCGTRTDDQGVVRPSTRTTEITAVSPQKNVKR